MRLLHWLMVVIVVQPQTSVFSFHVAHRFNTSWAPQILWNSMFWVQRDMLEEL